MIGPPIIDALKTLGYADFKDGLHFPKEEVRYQSRIWASQKLIDLFYEYHFSSITRLKEAPPRELIQLRAPRKEGGRKLKYKDNHRTETMRDNLIRYNKFIEKQDIEVRLPADAEISWQFLETRAGNILSDRIEITNIDTNNEWIVDVGNTKYYGYQIEGMRFLIDNGDIPVEVKKLISDHQVQYINLNTYFTIHINHYLHNPINTNSIPIPTPTPTKTSSITSPMTQSFCPIANINQSLPLPKPTTIRGEEDYTRKRPLSEYGIRRLDFRSKYQRLHRVFTQYLDRGGRFYGAVHLDLPSEIRPYIFINGNPTAELDYGAHHVRMLYHWLEIPYAKDPYEELCRRPDERPIYKKVLLVGINAKDEKTAIQAISNELREEGFSGECLTHKYLKECLARFKEFHEPIARFIHRGHGLSLQYDDSRIIDEILMWMVRKKIPVLPVHDSIIAPAEHKDTLRQVMKEAYQKIMGNGLLPMIK